MAHKILPTKKVEFKKSMAKEEYNHKNTSNVINFKQPKKVEQKKAISRNY